MDLRPLLAGIAVASGGSALLCYLKLRELTWPGRYVQLVENRKVD